MSLHPWQEWASDWPLPAVAIALFAVLTGLRFVVPPEERGRVRAGIFFVGAYLVSLFLVSLGAPIGADGAAATPHLLTLRILYRLLFCFAVVLATGLVTFDLVLVRRQIPRILRDLLQGIAYLITAIGVLSRSDVDVTKIFTASVLTTAVIGLALQETLGNVMAGLALQIERDFEVGDWIRVDEKLSGRIHDLRWRVTSLITTNGDLVLIPNGQVARAVLTNFSRVGSPGTELEFAL